MPPIKPRKEYQNLNLPSMFGSSDDQPQVEEKQRRREKSAGRRRGANSQGSSGGNDNMGCVLYINLLAPITLTPI